MAVWGFSDFAAHRRISKTVVAGTIAVSLVAAGWMTWIQVGRWRDSFSLYRHTLPYLRTMSWYTTISRTLWVDKDSATKQPYNLGLVLMQSQPEKSIVHFNTALSLKPGFKLAQDNLNRAQAQINTRRP